ncbi:plasma-membrane proton-efflux P-type ATPase [Desulfovibrio inopinatus]|uniref:plasma-membrane proton-efflux P-type ATPase n=1 Tax=Desulfovibrio inopinatus TaxID=102109 RepID=UPI0004211207|nr:plasma-membrane proton-efflux P-type ATPase [Desulfovibrio inopinatus]
MDWQIDSDTAQKQSGDEVLQYFKTSLSQGLSSDEAASRLEQVGKNALETTKVNPLLQFLGYFWGPIPWMIEAAAILSVVVRDWVDFSIIMALLIFNALIGFWEEFKAANALDALKSQLALQARALRDGKWQETPAEDLVPGDIVRLRLGDVIPADVKLLDGDYISIDQAALTGESLPVNKQPGDVAYSGSVAKQGEMVAVVTGTGGNTFFGRTAKLVESAGATSHFQKAVMKVGDFLIFVAIGLAIILIGTEIWRGKNILDLVQFVLILVVASIPVAMPAVLSVTMALGALSLSKMKAIVAKLQSIEEMAGIDILCSDKTGTLTKNQLTLGDPILFGAQNADELILAGALASKAENQDAIDLAILGGVKDQSTLSGYTQTKFTPFDPVSKRTSANITDASGKSFTIAKGAPQVILALSNMSEADSTKAVQTVDELAAKGYRTIAVARSEDGTTWTYLGILPLYDPPRDDSAETIRQAMEHGIQVKMVTGDDTAIGREISRQLGMGTNIQSASDVFKDVQDIDNIPESVAARIEKAEGFGQVFPEHKYGIVKALQKRGHLVAMTGDGVNDAPALKQADAGVAVSGATDAARAAAALVLTAPGLSVIIKAVEEARRIFERMMSYTIYRIAMTIDIMFFVVLAMLVYDIYPLTAVMIILLALLDDIPIMTIAYDNAFLEKKPVKWDMHRVLSISSVLGGLAVVETFGLLYLAEKYAMPMWGLQIKHIQTMLFLQLVAGGHLMLFLTRTKRAFFLPPYPSWQLFWAIVLTQIFAVILCGYGFGLVPAIPWDLIGYVWLYNFIWMLVQDLVKLGTYTLINNEAKHKRGFLRNMSRSLHSHGDLHRS